MAIQDSLPKSRITLVYRTTINGEPETVKLPLRLLILGDFSHETSADYWKRKEPVFVRDEDGKLVQQFEPELDDKGQPKLEDGKPVFSKVPLKKDLKVVGLGERRLRSITGSNINSVMKDMDIRLNLEVPDHISGGKPLSIELPITGMKSFDPDEIAKKVPKLEGLRLIRNLLREIQSKIDNSKDLRETIRKVYTDSKRESLVKAIEDGAKENEYKGFLLPSGPTVAADANAGGTGGTGGTEGGSGGGGAPAAADPQTLKSVFAAVEMPLPATKTALVDSEFTVVTVNIPDEKQAEANRLASSLAALLQNVKGIEGKDKDGKPTFRFDKGQVLKAIERTDELISLQLNEILHHKQFQELEATWRGLQDLVDNTNFKADITIDILDVTKKDLGDDFENNSSDIFSGELFEKVYIKEYDQYGGRPFGAMIGLYEFDSTKDDLDWLQRMGKLANAAHCPFISAVSPKFFDGSFGDDDAHKVEAIKDLPGHLASPKFSKWSKLRDTEEAAYLGLTFPRYALRLPWHPENNPCKDLDTFQEDTRKESKEEMLARLDEADRHEIAELDKSGLSSPDDPRKKPEKDSRKVAPEKYLWGNSAILFARNLVKAFEIAGWCQAIRGPKGGGTINGLPVDTFKLRGQTEIMPPVEIAIPDYREWEFAKNGFIPLVYRKDSGEACFFSTQAVKSTKKFKDPKDSENSQLVANLAYTFSVTRLAHYVKSMMRDNIGSTADEIYIQQHLQSWLAGYVTTVASPDDLTVRRFPFKAATVEVASKPGEIGMYDCKIAVLPHIQFEGLNVTLMLESRLGSAK